MVMLQERDYYRTPQYRRLRNLNIFIVALNHENLKHEIYFTKILTAGLEMHVEDKVTPHYSKCRIMIL